MIDTDGLADKCTCGGFVSVYELPEHWVAECIDCYNAVVGKQSQEKIITEWNQYIRKETTKGKE